MKRLSSLVLTLALLGCSSQSGWSRQDMPEQQVAKELADCKSQARAATQRDSNIMSDIMATRGGDWQRTGVMSAQMQSFGAENANRSTDIVNRCMAGKGFIPNE
jgi:hypothetical protein